MAEPTVSFLIPTHRRRELLERTLRLLEEMPGPSREVVVIDDASQDGTAEMLRSCFPRVRVLRNDTPRGFDALPDAIRLARGEWLFLLDDDAYPAEGTLERAVRHAETRGPELGLVALPFVEPESGRAQYTPYFPHTNGHPYGPAHGFIAGAVLVRREAALAVPPSPPGYFMYETEPAAMLEYLAAGWEADYLPSAPVYHLYEARSRQIRPAAAYLPFRNDLVTMKRYYRGWRRVEMVAGRYLTGLVHLAVAGRPGDWWRAVREADEMLAKLPPRRLPRWVLERVYPCFDGLTLATLASETNRRRVAWIAGLLPADQAG